MNCRNVKDRLILYYYEELEGKEQESIEEHLSTCTECQRTLNILKEDLDRINIIEPDIQQEDYQRIGIAINQEIDKLSQKKGFLSGLRIRPLYIAVSMLLILAISYGLFKGYERHKEESFISENYELLINLDMFENLELLEHLDEIQETS
jgi:hypothetical protein